MVGAAVAGDYERARGLHHELGPLFRGLFVETNPIPVKGGDADPRVRPRLRPPALSRLADEYVDDLDSILAELENPDGEDAFAEVER